MEDIPIVSIGDQKGGDHMKQGEAVVATTPFWLKAKRAVFFVLGLICFAIALLLGLGILSYIFTMFMIQMGGVGR